MRSAVRYQLNGRYILTCSGTRIRITSATVAHVLLLLLELLLQIRRLVLSSDFQILSDLLLVEMLLMLCEDLVCIVQVVRKHLVGLGVAQELLMSGS